MERKTLEDLSTFDWALKSNPVVEPSKGKGTTDVKFVSEAHKERFINALIRR